MNNEIPPILKMPHTSAEAPNLKSRVAHARKVLHDSFVERIEKAGREAVRSHGRDVLAERAQALVDQAVGALIEDAAGLDRKPDYTKMGSPTRWMLKTRALHNPEAKEFQKSLKDVIKSHMAKLVDQLRRSLPAMLFDEEELAAAKNVYYARLNEELPKALERAAVADAQRLAKEIVAQHLDLAAAAAIKNWGQDATGAKTQS